ncbi:hypothetical protein VSR01_27290 [Actinacidiphila sp. DG2A-62]|jgi:hypothetical protein|uniref:hypothetical protein n=1 Tax=Actinacidiphila sp. DG2A-62 TaxID=3108821 RepID=UPI002DBC75D0|nr:hypothetical protein [Actinacidiphila sp. DG2A-62]MEC3997012.1 hypothetical protein [Actinacidiphila sp. DG2A-62]
MGKTAVIRYETKPEAADENQRVVEQVFAELAETQPEGLRYATFRLDDGVTFVHIVSTEGDADPLPQLAAFQAFQKGLGERLAGKPSRGAAHVVGSYKFLSE